MSATRTADVVVVVSVKDGEEHWPKRSRACPISAASTCACAFSTTGPATGRSRSRAALLGGDRRRAPVAARLGRGRHRARLDEGGDLDVLLVPADRLGDILVVARSCSRRAA